MKHNRKMDEAMALRGYVNRIEAARLTGRVGGGNIAALMDKYGVPKIEVPSGKSTRSTVYYLKDQVLSRVPRKRQPQADQPQPTNKRQQQQVLFDIDNCARLARIEQQLEQIVKLLSAEAR